MSEDLPLGTARPAGRARIGASFVPGIELPELPKLPEIAKAESESPADVHEPSTPSAPRPKRKPQSKAAGRPTTTAPTAVSGSKADQSIPISLPKSLHERLKAYKASTGRSHPTILFDAIEATIDQLPELLRERTVSAEPSSRRLFNRPSTMTRQSTGDEPKETLILRITPDNKAVIDELIHEVGAPSRNALLVAAYDGYLPGK